MNNLRMLIRYFCLKYPYKTELSKARITKMVYLADWFHTQKYDKQITDINWVFNHYGPYVDDVHQSADADPEIDVLHTSTVFGTPKVLVQAKNGLEIPDIKSSHKEIADSVIESTKHLSFNEFVRYVYSTYPIK